MTTSDLHDLGLDSEDLDLSCVSELRKRVSPKVT